MCREVHGDGSPALHSRAVADLAVGVAAPALDGAIDQRTGVASAGGDRIGMAELGAACPSLLALAEPTTA